MWLFYHNKQSIACALHGSHIFHAVFRFYKTLVNIQITKVTDLPFIPNFFTILVKIIVSTFLWKRWNQLFWKIRWNLLFIESSYPSLQTTKTIDFQRFLLLFGGKTEKYQYKSPSSKYWFIPVSSHIEILIYMMF